MKINVIEKTAYANIGNAENSDKLATLMPSPKENEKKFFGERHDSILFNKEREQPVTTSSSGIKNNSGTLTVRLVMASGQFEVRQIIADANKELVNMRVASATMEGRDAAAAIAAVRSLERLINRGVRKIRDLDKEDMLRLEKARTQQEKQLKRARELKEELQEKQQARKTRERRYLLDVDKHTFGIEAQAAFIAAVEAAAVSVAPTGGVDAGGVDVGAADAGGEFSVEV